MEGSDKMTDTDVLVVGGGPAGCSAAVFTARYGLDTLVLDRGSSSIRQCAFIENYLGFPGGIDVGTFYAMSQAHVERVGGRLRDEMVTLLERTDDGFLITTQSDEHTADRVVAASTYDVSYLEPLLGEHFRTEDGEAWIDPELAGERGTTPVEGLWLAGPTAGVESQIAVSVGHGARVGLDAVADYRRTQEGIWDDAAEHTDWTVTQGRYEGQEWLEGMTAYRAETAPNHLDDAYVARKARELAERQQDQQISESDVDRRTNRAHRRLLDYIADELILERAETIRSEPEAETTEG
jgi:hypothetical protein